MNRLTLVTLLAAACSSDPQIAPRDAVAEVSSDVGSELAVDVLAVDALGDAPALDADEPDAAADVANEAPVDAPSIGLDASADSEIDAAQDARIDARLDAPIDAAQDARIDARLDAPSDAASGPRVDRAMPQLYQFTFRADEADPMATRALGIESAYLDTRVAPRGRLVVYLHGAGAPTTCGSPEHERLLSSWGFHVIAPCYISNYGVGGCGTDIRGCRLEAFEGVDHHPFVAIAPPDSIERRVVRALQRMRTRNPAGDWGYFLDGERPRWSAIVISGISHGASTSGVIAQVRPVERAVMLSGPLDTSQAWLTAVGMSAPAAFWGLTHTGDSQHSGHIAAFASLRLPGAPVTIDGAASPFGGSHRFRSAAPTSDGHGSTQAGGSSPRDSAGRYRFEPAWRLMYGAP